MENAAAMEGNGGYAEGYGDYAGHDNGMSPWDPSQQGYHQDQAQHMGAYDEYGQAIEYNSAGEEYGHSEEYVQPWQGEHMAADPSSPWGGAGEPIQDQSAFGGGGLFMPLGEMDGPGYSAQDEEAMQGARGSGGRGRGSGGRGSRGRGRGRGSGRGAMGTPQELMSFLSTRKVTEVEGVMSMLGVQTLSDLQELMPEDLEALAMTPLQRRRLLNAIEESKNGAFIPAEDPSGAVSGQMSAMEQAPEQQPEADASPEPAPASRGWETAEVKAAREAAAEAAANQQGGIDDEGLNWQQEMLQKQGGTVTAEEATAGATSGQVMLSGDWICGKCSEHNFARRTRCWKCRARNTGNAGTLVNSPACVRFGCPASSCLTHRWTLLTVTVVAPTEKKAGKPGDWDCAKCNAANFARRKACYQCGGPKADPTGKDGQPKQGQGGGKKKQQQQQQQQQAAQKSGEETWDGKKASDWTCSHCSARNFKRNIRCFQCHAARKVSEKGGGGRAGGTGNAASSSSGQGSGGQGSAGSGAGGSGTTATPEQERKAVDILCGMLRKCKNNEQVVSVLVQHFAESHAALKSAVLPRAAVGGPRKWFQTHSDTFQLGSADNYGQSIVRLKQIPVRKHTQCGQPSACLRNSHVARFVFGICSRMFQWLRLEQPRRARSGKRLQS